MYICNMGNENKVVYRHIRNDTNEVFYIGMGSLKRASVSYSRSKHWHSIVKKEGRTVEVLACDLSIDEANELEMFLISEYGYKNLCNQTLGGGGQRGTKHWLGKRHSNETKEKCKLINLGRKRSEETKQKIRKANLGKTLSEETKKKISESSTESKKVIDTSNGNVYSSIKDGAIAIGRNPTTIRQQLSGRKKIQTYNTLRYYE